MNQPMASRTTPTTAAAMPCLIRMWVEPAMCPGKKLGSEFGRHHEIDHGDDDEQNSQDIGDDLHETRSLPDARFGRAK